MKIFGARRKSIYKSIIILQWGTETIFLGTSLMEFSLDWPELDLSRLLHFGRQQKLTRQENEFLKDTIKALLEILYNYLIT